MNKPNGSMPTSNLGAQTSIQPDTPIPDWITLHPKVTHTAYRLYAIMRSLLAQEGRDGDLWLSHDDIAAFMPGPSGKKSSISTIKSALKVLEEIGVVANPNGERIATSPGAGRGKAAKRYQLNDWPPGRNAGAHAGHVELPNFVYLIGNAESPIAKIGTTKHLDRRLKTIQRASGRKLEALWTTPGGVPLEGWLHRQFHNLRTHGEWFDFGDLDPVTTVATMAAKYEGGVK